MSTADSVKPSVSWQELQRRKLIAMSESVRHFKDVNGTKIVIHPNVYPPGTDTYLMAGTVRIQPGQTALDIGTGTGAIACKLALEGASYVLGVDLNPRAVKNAQENKELLNLSKVTFKQGDIFEGIDEEFDVITFNPPYTDRKPNDDIDICFFDKDHEALRRFFSELGRHLKPGGRAYIAWSNFGTAGLLPKLAAEHGFDIKLAGQDVGGRGYVFYVYELTPTR